MAAERSFGDWLRQRRKALDLTQEEFARQVGCSGITLRKLEAEDRRPSKQIAERLADVLNIPPDDRESFLRFARGDPFAAPEAVVASEPPQMPRHNLPLQLTSFIGREQEIGEVTALVSQARLVTLTGAGGTGKTRLALQAAAGLESLFDDGVWWVELARLGDPAFVASSVAAALNVTGIAGRPIAQTLVDYLRPRRLLLVLDNCEHLIQACAELAELLLQACPHLNILATSREELGLAGERIYPVGSLSLPDPQRPQTAEALVQSEAVRLFVDRCQSALSSFTLTSATGPEVARVCRQLDGIPLALELAAARIRVMRVDEIAAGLADRYRLLRGGARTDLPRHQTLQAMVDWSYDLLSPSERTLFRRLGVFVGGATLSAVQAVCADETLPPDQVLDQLGLLVSKSLVNVDQEQAGGTRYNMLETIRQYALAKLAGSAEAETVRLRHAAHYLAFAQSDRPDPVVDEPAYARWLASLLPEEGNLRATLSWSQLGAGNVELGLRVIWQTYEFWVSHGYWTEARGWLETALARAEAEPVHDLGLKAWAIGHLGQLNEMQGHYAAAQTRLSEALRLYQELGNRRWGLWAQLYLGIVAREAADAATARHWLEDLLAQCRPEDEGWRAWSLVTLGEVFVMQEDTALAASVLEQGQTLCRQLEIWDGLAWSLNHLGHIAQLQGDYDLARRRHEASLPLFRATRTINIGNLGEAWAFQGLGETALAQGAAARAAENLRRALTFFGDLGDRAGVSWCLSGLAGAAVLDEEPKRAARLWGAAEALRQAIGCRPAPAARATRERLMAAARQQLGGQAFDAAWAEGQALTMEQALALGLAVTAANSSAPASQ